MFDIYCLWVAIVIIAYFIIDSVTTSGPKHEELGLPAPSFISNVIFGAASGLVIMIILAAIWVVASR